MARTAPIPNAAAIPGMNPGVFILGGGGDGSGSGAGGGRGRGNGQGANGKGSGHDARGDARSAPDPSRYPECGTVAHPVDVVTGRAFTHTLEDIVLQGPLPLRWHRVYSTAMRQRDAGLGWGWAHSMGWTVEVRRRRVLVWNDHGVPVEFPSVAEGQEVIGPWGWVLRREAGEAQGYVVDADDGVLRHFGELAADGPYWKLTAVEDQNTNRIALEYEGGLLSQVTDSAGRVLRVDHAERGRIERVRTWTAEGVGEWRVLVQYRYDVDGCLFEVTDAEGHSWRYAYDGDHRLIQEIDRTGLTFEFVYDSTGRCIESWGHHGERADLSLAPDVSAKLADGTPARGIHHAKLAYYPDGYTEVVDSQEVRRFFGNAHGLLDKAISGGAVLSCTYDASGFLLSRTDEEGATTTYERDRRGRIVKETDPLGRVTVTERDAEGRPIAVIDPAGGVTKIDRDARGNEITVTDPAGATTRYAYDSRGLVTEIVSPVGGCYRFAHDAHGNRMAATLPDGAIWRWTYNALGRCLSDVSPLGEVTRFSWSLRGDLLAVHRPDGGTTRYEYDGEQRLTRITDPEGRTTQIEWGGYHKMVARKIGHAPAVQFRYDREGNPVLVQNERGEQHRLTYEESGLLIGERTFDGREIRYRHDQAGRVVRINQGSTSVIEMAYNAAGELVRRAVGGEEQAFEYNLRGELLRATCGADEYTFERDACGRVVGELQVVDGVAQSVRATRDATGAPIRRSTSRGHTLAIDRDGSGLRRRTVVNGDHALVHETDPSGHEVRRLLPEGGRIETKHAPNGRLAERRVRTPGPSIPAARTEPPWWGHEPGLTVERRYAYDRSAELMSVLDSFEGTAVYTYDDATQLVEVRGPEGLREAFEYDAAGNPREAGPRAPIREYGSGNRLLSRGDVMYTWDELGRLSEKRLTPDHAYRYTWTEDGALASVQCPDGCTVDFRYDPFGRRVRKRVFAAPEAPGARRPGRLLEEVRFVWDGDELVHEIKTRAIERGASVVGERTYGFDDDGLVPLFQYNSAFGPGPGLFHYLTDPVGAPEQLVDGAGRVVCTLIRSAWGAALPRAAAVTSTPLRFPGQYADDETRLHYNRFRYYDPEIGLYLSPDLLGLAGGIHPYRYGWNPTHWIDPLGLVTHTPGTGLVYLRTDPMTGKEYVGRSMSREAYKERRRTHDRALQKRCPGAPNYQFFVLEGGIGAAPALAQAEEDWIRAGGGPGGKPGQSGQLENKIHAQAKTKYKGSVPFP